MIFFRRKEKSVETLAERVAELGVKYEQLAREVRNLWRVVLRIEKRLLER